LQSTSERGHILIVQLLLEKGTNPNWREAGCQGALQSASSRGKTEIVQLLLGMGADPNLRNNEDAGALQLASWEGYPEIVRLLLDKGADPMRTDPVWTRNVMQAPCELRRGKGTSTSSASFSRRVPPPIFPMKSVAAQYELRRTGGATNISLNF
jgi:ankyrin repeat protein